MDLELHRIIAFQHKTNETLRLSVEALAHENERLRAALEICYKLHPYLEKVKVGDLIHYLNDTGVVIEIITHREIVVEFPLYDNNKYTMRFSEGEYEDILKAGAADK